MITTVGVDLAAEPARTAAVRIDWAQHYAIVNKVAVPATDDTIVSFAGDADKIGIDCPLGWPLPFVDFITAHMGGRVDTAADTIEARRRLVYRATDLACQQLGLRPLSVAADRIGHAALRCAGLLSRLGELDRSGAGRVVEVYPAGSLQIWNLPYRRYKNDPALLVQSLAALEQRVGLRFADLTLRSLCVSSDHAFDAVVAGVTARANALGRTAPPPDPLAVIARQEGWIALPDPDLAALR